MKLLTDDDSATRPLKKVRLSCATVLSMTEADFLRLLYTIETDFPDAKMIFKTVSAGKLWIQRGTPTENSTQ